MSDQRWYTITDDGYPPEDTVCWIAGHTRGSLNLGTQSTSWVAMAVCMDGIWMDQYSDRALTSLDFVTHWQPLPQPAHPAPQALLPPVREVAEPWLQERFEEVLTDAQTRLARFEADGMRREDLAALRQRVMGGEAARQSKCPYKMQDFLNRK